MVILWSRLSSNQHCCISPGLGGAAPPGLPRLSCLCFLGAGRDRLALWRPNLPGGPCSVRCGQWLLGQAGPSPGTAASSALTGP